MVPEGGVEVSVFTPEEREVFERVRVGEITPEEREIVESVKAEVRRARNAAERIAAYNRVPLGKVALALLALAELAREEPEEPEETESSVDPEADLYDAWEWARDERAIAEEG